MENVKELKIRREHTKLLDDLLRKGYLIGNGETTYPLTCALKKANANIINGYDQSTKQVVLALKNSLEIRLKHKTLNFAFFDLKEKK